MVLANRKQIFVESFSAVENSSKSIPVTHISSQFYKRVRFMKRIIRPIIVIVIRSMASLFVVRLENKVPF